MRLDCNKDMGSYAVTHRENYESLLKTCQEWERMYIDKSVQCSKYEAYPTDRDGWICSVCRGWNVPKDRVCMHSHLPTVLNRGAKP